MEKTKTRRRPILMGEAERVATNTEDPHPTPLTQSLLKRSSKRSIAPNELVSITPKCHRDAEMTVWYCQSDGCALLVCSTCGAGVARLLLAVEVPS